MDLDCNGNSCNISKEKDQAAEDTAIELRDGNLNNYSMRLEKRVNYVNFGEDDEMKIYGYRTNLLRAVITWFLTIASGGILRLLFRWFPRLKLLATHSKCPLDKAETVLLVEKFQKKHKNYYVKKLECIRGEAVLKAYRKRKDSLANEHLENCNSVKIDEKHEKPMLSVHFGGGTFKHVRSIVTFTCKKLTYVWDDEKREFIKLGGLDKNVLASALHQLPALDGYQQYMRRSVYGSNEILVPVKSILILFFTELSNPFYIFQLFSFCLWIADVYMYYAMVILTMSFVSVCIDVFQIRKNQNNLRSTVSSSDVATTVLRDRSSGEIATILAEHLVPGDILAIPSHGCQMPCDAILLTGNCIMNESMLTGESVPVTKTPLPAIEMMYDPKEHARHTLYCGTRVLQTRYIGNEKVLAVVIRTGFSTSKGSLVRSIMYPPPVDFKFEQDSYKFVALLSLIAGFGVIYTIVSKTLRGVRGLYIAMEALDLVTVVVPPALPAAMTVGRFIAQSRLQKKKIYCTSPRSINVSGSIDCVCFDKTGTLTEDGLDMWGIVPVSMEGFQLPIKDVKHFPLDKMLIGMATCHGITIMDNELAGDPLDLKMFESTGWVLKEPDISDTHAFSMLFPTVVRPPFEKSMKQDTEIGIFKQFPFTSSLQRMSVITGTNEADHYDLFCKGSPEIIYSLSKPNTIPSNFDNVLQEYTSEGYRVIALGYKSLKCVPYAEMQRIARETVESDLDFLGFVVLENRLKTETSAAILALNNANIKVVMITGDNMLTALSVAKSCHIVRSDTSVVTVTAVSDQNQEKPEVHFTRNNSDQSDGFNDKYVFTLTGKTWALVKQHLPELIPKLVTRGVVFARMSPDQKQQLVQELQTLGYNVAMVGDGANDCGALKAAHLGISLSDTESSVASPFTSRETNIHCVLTVIREGRAALVTSFGIFKYMAAYSLTQFISVILLYEIEANLTDFEFLYIDLFIISALAFFFGRTKAHDGPLVKRTPLTSLISFTPILSLVLQISIVAIVQYASLWHARRADWFVPFRSSENKRSIGCYENYTIFIVSCFQYIILAVVFSKGHPYRKSLFSNHGLICSCVFLTLFSSYLAITPSDWLAKLFKLVIPPDLGFRLVLFAYGLINFILAMFAEHFLVEYLIFAKLRHRWRDVDKSKRRYLRIERGIEKDCTF